jgi:ferredoxin
MATLNIAAVGTYEVKDGQRLVLAIEQCGVDIGHRCGGHARCTTCRVNFISGEPDTMTRAEYEKLKDRGLLGEMRLSCQILTDGAMTVEPLMRVQDMGWDDPGPEPEASITPEPEWLNRDEV